MVKRYLFLFTFVLLAVMVGCSEKESEDPEVTKRANQLAIEYIQEEEGRTLVPDEIEFSTGIGARGCWVTGHYKDKPSEVVSVAISYDKGGKDMEVDYLGRPPKEDK
ncbi:hypothetical protein [Bacillus massilinigeriensis]|uniref:hypothetical protein n=1 Tax=Bacillus mediterraneensis TaxID=1805474 RepID=UPI0008F80061|nr:hypothetical protein [Bacillus mediterraneensis]